MAVLDVVLFGLVCLAALGEGAPQGEVSRAKSRPFGSGLQQPEYHPQPQVKAPVRLAQEQEKRPTFINDFYQSDAQLQRASAPRPVAPKADNRPIPSAPVISAKEGQAARAEGKSAVYSSVKNQNQNQQGGASLRTATSDDAEFKRQAENAHYSFATFVDDGIMGHAQSRSEVRDGLAVEGMYSYNDGFFHRSVHYVADQNGYRVIKEVNEPIGDGPVVDPKGEAVVRSSLGSEYTITLDDIKSETAPKNSNSNSRQ